MPSPRRSLLPLLLLSLGCVKEIRATSIRDPGHAFSRRPLHVVVMEREQLASFTRGLDAALAQTLRQGGVAATVRYDTERSARSYLLQQLHDQDAGGYGLLVRIEEVSRTVQTTNHWPLDPPGSTAGVSRLVFGVELFDLTTGAKVWKALLDMGDYAHDRDLAGVLSRALLARARGDGVFS